MIGNECMDIAILNYIQQNESFQFLPACSRLPVEHFSTSIRKFDGRVPFVFHPAPPVHPGLLSRQKIQLTLVCPSSVQFLAVFMKVN